ncbi:DUF885 family protein [Pyrinomonas methylaliphatogenes]|uniref:X-Pro dipeptidyl-peptidase n=1 Tax=Pyrinomonas methylaliphatogenes TaxID=454194 RepID=A0A0B6WTU2_9BACT|nr:DUF885 family protein [Pyrinomonas methylaliphatogenes]MBX5478419.1 DUF885 domain-containing protein [Pyrinomonas methylaliphatogenes]CDM64092.1 hypothetical protein PYK22_00084 [Pyrinomonas methylaliphatogenes]
MIARRTRSLLAASLIFILFAGEPSLLLAQTRSGESRQTPSADLDIDRSQSELRPLIERYNVDRASLTRTYPLVISPTARERFRKFYTEWLDRLAALDFDRLSQDGRIDYLLFKDHLEHELRQLDIQAKQFAEVEALLPFARAIFELDDSRRRMARVDAPRTAAMLDEMRKQIDGLRRSLEERLPARASGSNGSSAPPIRRNVALRAVNMLASLRATLKNWFDSYNGYDPIFTWWIAEPYRAVDQALQNYNSFLGERMAGVSLAQSEQAQSSAPPGGPQPERARRLIRARPGDTSDIVGDPIGRDALMAELAAEMIAYTPEELIEIANKEMAWCEAEMIKASRELGYGDDWKRALEHVKNQYVEPGKQPDLIRDLALEAIDFVEKNNLVTVPPLALETWRMQMMTPERQLVNPFFTGGETISISYPTNTMSHEQKMMSMRGNNIHFARATVFHELIPGHHLQGFMAARYKPYRAPFRTPFLVEGWALYWEFLLWDMNFPKTPENRIGMLFWRMHRCARVIFSLRFHLGEWTPQQCIDFLIQRVGHEPENAIAEVRRSFDGSYEPLYQAAYLLGGLQLYALHKELVGTGKMTDRAFHDAVLKENSIPVEMIRAKLTGERLTRDFKPQWKFYDSLARP